MTRQHRHYRGTRRQPRISLPKTALIVCEDAKTEPHYFIGLKACLRITGASVVVVGAGAAPITVVQKAVTRKHDFDYVWCVFDVEEHGKNASLARALNMAKDNEIPVALSNPTFEYWLLLHFEKTGRSFSNGKEVNKFLRKHIPRYEKGFVCDAGLLEKHPTAIKHAREIERAQWHGQDRLQRNPSTDVYKVAELLLEISKQLPYRLA
jgi:hypothetical protein